MKTIFWITRTELKALFYTPIAWIVLILFASQTGLVFADGLNNIVRSQELRYPVGYISSELFTGRNGVFPNVLKYAYLYIPLLTMGLISREYSSGSIKLLYSAPVRPFQIVLGKYLAILAFGAVIVLLLMLQVSYAWYYVESFDIKLVASGLLGIFLLIAAYAAIGLFMSCRTAYQMVAAIGTLAILALLNFVNKIGQGTDFIRDLTYWLSVNGRAEHFIRGVLLSNDIIYFLLLITLFILWSTLKLQTDRKHYNIAKIISAYSGVIIMTVLLGYISSRPKWILFHDATREKSNTLSKDSQEIMQNIPGPLKITTYTNLLDADYNTALPEWRNNDLARFDQYRYAKPEIQMDYVYYYMPTQNPSLDKRYPDMSPEQRARELAKIHKVPFDLFLPPDSVAHHEELKAQGYHFIRVVDHISSGKKAYLRLFDDATRHPSEAEISIALKRMAMPMPVVGFLAGFDGRDSKRDGDKHYHRFAREKGFRFSLVNQGFDAADVSLRHPVKPEVTILVIADIRRAFSPEELKNLLEYIARGGNMLITAEPHYGAEYLNNLLGSWGIQLDSEALTQPNDEYSAELIQARPTAQLIELSPYFEVMKSSPRVVTMPGVTNIKFVDSLATIHPILEATSEGSTEKKVTGIIASRSHGDRIQKIVVLGDADCFSNAEISMRRKKVRASNFSLATGLFNWLSDGLAPLDTSRPAPLDIVLDLDSDRLSYWAFFFRFAIPITLLLGGSILLLVRRRR